MVTKLLLMVQMDTFLFTVNSVSTLQELQ